MRGMGKSPVRVKLHLSLKCNQKNKIIIDTKTPGDTKGK